MIIQTGLLRVYCFLISVCTYVYFSFNHLQNVNHLIYLYMSNYKRVDKVLQKYHTFQVLMCVQCVIFPLDYLFDVHSPKSQTRFLRGVCVPSITIFCSIQSFQKINLQFANTKAVTYPHSTASLRLLNRVEFFHIQLSQSELTLWNRFLHIGATATTV